MSEQLKVGLIGAGVFAGYHASKLAQHPRVEFTGVVDRSGKRAALLAETHNIEVLALADLLEKSDAVVIASPATAHGEIAKKALSAGCHCLIEKPLATSLSEAEMIAVLSLEKNLVVQVGHQERMVLKAIGLDRISERPLKIEAVRNAAYSPRGTDTSVTFDLMTHDIDLCTALMGGAPDSVKGESGCVRSLAPDMAYAELSYGTSVARLSASRVAEAGQRWMKLSYPSGDVKIDFNAKTLLNSTRFALDKKFADNKIAKDSLGAATDMFVRAVLDGGPVSVSADAGAIAVRIAESIDKGRAL